MYKIFASLISVLILIISVTATEIIQKDEIDRKDIIEDISSLVLSNAFVEKVQCVTGILNQIDKEFELEDLLTNVEPKILININNILLCLKYEGNWQSQR